MARFVLTPCHIREDRVVPSGDAVELDWPKVAALLAPSQSPQALTTLTRMRTNSYVGLLRPTKVPQQTKVLPSRALEPVPTNFIFLNDNRGNEIGWLLKRQPDFPDRVEQIYRVDVALFDTKIEEHSSGEPA